MQTVGSSIGLRLFRRMRKSYSEEKYFQMFSDVSIFSYVSLRPCIIDRTLSLRGSGFEGDGFSSA